MAFFLGKEKPCLETYPDIYQQISYIAFTMEDQDAIQIMWLFISVTIDLKYDMLLRKKKY